MDFEDLRREIEKVRAKHGDNPEYSVVTVSSDFVERMVDGEEKNQRINVAVKIGNYILMSASVIAAYIALDQQIGPLFDAILILASLNSWIFIDTYIANLPFTNKAEGTYASYFTNEFVKQAKEREKQEAMEAQRIEEAQAVDRDALRQEYQEIVNNLGVEEEEGVDNVR